jgi:hypothetical protein
MRLKQMPSSQSTVLSFALLLGIAAGCSQPTAPSRAASEPPAAANPVRALSVSAGEDEWLPLGGAIVLSVFASAPPSPITSYAWRKMSGPSSYAMESPESWRTTVTNLEPGTYEFEVTVTATDGTTAKDAVSIHVYDPRGPGANAFTFRNVRWYCPMGCAATIENIEFPPNSVLRVFVKKAIEEEWMEAKPEKQWLASDKFVYGVGNNRLWVYANDESGAIDIRIMF